MEENFNPVARTRANYYTPGSPVQFVCVELLKGELSGENAVCLTFKNISKVTLTALEIHFKCKGVDGIILCEDAFEYREIEVKPGESFGMDDAVFVTQKAITSVDVVLKNVYSGKKVVHLDAIKRVRLPAPRRLSPELQKALEAGAACYVAEQPYDNAAPALLVSNVRRALSVLAAEYYGHPAEQLTLIGLTGTKGKTTTTYFIKNILDTAFGHRTAVLSTVEMYTGGESTEAHLTTPESLELQQCFADTLAHGIRHLTMEVSSQAYKQQRVYGVPFTVGLFLNLSEDHIGPLEHESFEDYFQCKLQLMKNCKLAVICRGTDRFGEIYAAAKAHAERILVCGNDPSCDLWVENIRKETPGFTFTVCDKNSRRDFRITMEGRFNIENALAAITITRALGLPDDAIAAGIADVSVPGRMNVLQKDGRTVIVDYAHNFLSFTALFRSLKQDYPGAPIKVLCGCPGHKNLKRRVDIGHLCGEYADFVYLTAEDPGFEDPAEICREMAGYIGESHHRFIILPDRAAAVERSIAELAPGEILILAGKGEEDYQKVQGRYDFYESDLAIARRCLGL